MSARDIEDAPHWEFRREYALDYINALDEDTALVLLLGA